MLLEILVQDDSSSDFDAMTIIGPPASVQRNETNLGFAGNCNAGAARAHGDVLLFLNQDTVAVSDWFIPLLNMFSDSRVGVVGPKLVFPDTGDGRNIQSCGGLFDAGKGPFHRYIGYRESFWGANIRERVSWVTGAALAIRRSLFEKIGGFDTDYKRGYFEDTDLCMRARTSGYEVWYCPEAVFEHSPGSSGGVPPEVFKANSLRFHQRWDHMIVPDTAVKHVDY